jgi:hypothetical protein
VSPTENKTHELQIHREIKVDTIKQDSKSSLSIEIDIIFVQLLRSPPSLPYLIRGIKNKLLAHFYSRNYEMKLESGKEPQPSSILYISPRKRLNDKCDPRS